MMMNQRLILVIEDDAAIRRAIVDALRFEGYATVEAGTFGEGLSAALQTPCDLVLLDLVLPGGESKHAAGLDILAETRKARATLPVIILTALGDEAQRVRGLKLGADDYVVKPFSVKELLARVGAVLRRSPERPADVKELPVPGGRIDLARCECVFDDGRRAEISERELELLRYLAVNHGRAVTREEILSRVWGVDPKGITTRTIDMHVARLREKLRDDPAEPRIILTVRGKGYMFGNGTNGGSSE